MSQESGDPCGPHSPVGWDGRTLRFDPVWRTETVVALATGIDAGGWFDRMPILADALQEAGCELSEVLDHCRICDHHQSNCWALNLVLARPTLPAPAEIDSDQQIRLERLRRMSEASRVATPSRVPKHETIPLGVLSLLALLTLGAAGWLAYGPVPTHLTPTEQSIPDPFDPNAFTDAPEWRDAKSQIDNALRTSRGGRRTRSVDSIQPVP